MRPCIRCGRPIANNCDPCSECGAPQSRSAPASQRNSPEPPPAGSGMPLWLSLIVVALIVAIPTSLFFAFGTPGLHAGLALLACIGLAWQLMIYGPF